MNEYLICYRLVGSAACEVENTFVNGDSKVEALMNLVGSTSVYCVYSVERVK